MHAITTTMIYPSSSSSSSSTLLGSPTNDDDDDNCHGSVVETYTKPQEQLFVSQKDIWMNIMSFVGPGHYIFVAGVCKEFKELYEYYFSSLLLMNHSTLVLEVKHNRNNQHKNQNSSPVSKDAPPTIPMVKEWIGSRTYHHGDKILAKVTHTFYSAAFSSVECAKFWNQDTTASVPPNSTPVTSRGGGERQGPADCHHGHPAGRCCRLGDSLVCETIAKTGSVEVMKWARGHYCNDDDNILFGQQTPPYEPQQQHVGFGRFLRCPPPVVERKPLFPWNYWTCAFAAKHGHLEVLEFAIDEGCDWNLDKCASWAAQGGHLHILKWLRRHHEESWNSTNNKWISIFAAGGGHLDVLKWAHHCDNCNNNNTTTGTGGNNNNNNPFWDGLTCAYAAMNGHFKILQWARAHGCPWDERTCNWAANNGYNEIAQWAYDNGCPWDSRQQPLPPSSQTAAGGLMIVE